MAIGDWYLKINWVIFTFWFSFSKENSAKTQISNGLPGSIVVQMGKPSQLRASWLEVKIPNDD